MLGLILLMFVVDARGDTVQLVGPDYIEDARIYIDQPHYNYGADDAMRTFVTYRSLLKPILDTIPSGSTITAAVCSLYCTNNYADGYVRVSRITTDWVEGTSDGAEEAGACDWTCYAHPNEWTTPGGDGSDLEDSTNVTTKNTWYSWNVLGGITATYEGTAYGLIFTYKNPSDNEWATSEYATAARWPRVFVTYTPPVAGVTGSGSIVDGQRGIIEGGIVR